MPLGRHQFALVVLALILCARVSLAMADEPRESIWGNFTNLLRADGGSQVERASATQPIQPSQAKRQPPSSTATPRELPPLPQPTPASLAARKTTRVPAKTIRATDKRRRTSAVIPARAAEDQAAPYDPTTSSAEELVPPQGEMDPEAMEGEEPMPPMPGGPYPQWSYPTVPGGFRSGYQPLLGESWRYHPFGASFFMGGMWGENLMPNQIDQENGPFGGFRLAWDFGYHWGYETRLGLASVGTRQNPPLAGRNDNRIIVWDMGFLFYPWADTRWRPYGILAFGLADFYFKNPQGMVIHETLFGMPFGVGVKYRLNNRIVFRVELLDNVAFAGSTVDSTNNLSLSTGMEWRFGGHRKSYWPWNPSKNLW